MESLLQLGGSSDVCWKVGHGSGLVSQASLDNAANRLSEEFDSSLDRDLTTACPSATEQDTK